METIKGREYFRIPEWVQIAVFALAVSLASVALWAIVTPKERTVRYAKEKPHIYIVSRGEYLNLEGREIFCLEYTVDGVMQIPTNFTTEKQMVEFEQYLYRIGERGE